MLTNIRKLIAHQTSYNRKYCVLILMLLFFILNVIGVFLSLSIATSEPGLEYTWFSAIIFLMILPQMLSLMNPLPGLYLLIIFVMSYGLVWLLNFTFKDRIK